MTAPRRVRAREAAALAWLLALLPAGASAPPPCAAARAAAADEARVRELLERCRAAAGGEAWRASGKDLLIEGRALDRGLEGPWRLRLAADGRFAEAHDSSFPTRAGFDGTTAWSVDPTGLAARSTLEAREHVLVESALWSGRWCVEDGPIAVLGTAEGSGAALRLRPRDGELELELRLDEESALPAALDVTTYRGTRRATFAGWRAAAGGLQIAHERVVDDDGQESRTTVESVRLVEHDPAAFAFPATRPADVRFDRERPAAVATTLARTGHLLVRAEIDGADRGFWILDSGAGGLVLDPDEARALGYERHGSIWIGGAGALRSESGFYRGSTLRVGPATLERPHYSGFELDGLAGTFGVPLVGIVGYDFLQRVVATVDMGAGRVEVHDPGAHRRDDARWRPLVLHGRHPHVECTFGNGGEESALFRLDTGAAGVAVIFHSPFVSRTGLLEGRTTAEFRGLGGVGGESKARIGPIDWFELGGVVVDGPTAIFVEEPRGALADPWTAGTLGGDLLGRHELIFDYPHQRIGFAPRR